MIIDYGLLIFRKGGYLWHKSRTALTSIMETTYRHNSGAGGVKY